MCTRVVVASFFERLPLQSTRSDSHKLIQHHEFELELQGIAESLYWMADTNAVEVEQNHNQDVKKHNDDIHIDKIQHDTTLSDTRFQVQ